ncbi:hypothetical protein NQ317_003756 [Molorchus minor]|uniref:THAP-type domain-containing protein n=1 Tax=Molorchus minor TaxID=1323400 RepID=A0ABQ9JQQ2_9CUCU|nr:hypothetical protein NQ317_003756 [Molorchus minor]
MPTCFVRGCSNSHTKKRPDVTFHLIPKNSKTQWLSAIGPAPNIFVIQQRVCSEHFEEYDFERIGILRKIQAQCNSNQKSA